MLLIDHISWPKMRPGGRKMNLPIRAIIIAARRMGATVFKISKDETGEYDFQFKFNGIYRKVSLQTIMEYGQGNL